MLLGKNENDCAILIEIFCVMYDTVYMVDIK